MLRDKTYYLKCASFEIIMLCRFNLIMKKELNELISHFIDKYYLFDRPKTYFQSQILSYTKNDSMPQYKLH